MLRMRRPRFWRGCIDINRADEGVLRKGPIRANLPLREIAQPLGFGTKARLYWRIDGKTMRATFDHGVYNDSNEQGADARKLAESAIQIAIKRGADRFLLEATELGPGHFEGLGLRETKRENVEARSSSEMPMTQLGIVSIHSPARVRANLFSYEKDLRQK